MADERDDDLSEGNESTGQKTAGQRSDESEYGAQGAETMGNQGAEGSFGGESVGSQSGSADANGSSIAGGADDDGMGGQPIGGNDSNTGSGTTLTAGYTPASSDRREGFVGSRASESGDYLQDRNAPKSASSAEATGGSDFAKEGRGAPDDSGDRDQDDDSSR